MDIKERILATLNWEEPDEVPLTVYDWMLPRGEKGRRLRESGVGLVLRPPGLSVLLSFVFMVALPVGSTARCSTHRLLY